MGVLAYFVHGRGRGHASRSRPVIAGLRAAGHRVLVAAGDDALDLLRGPGGVPEDELREVASVRPGPGALRQVARRVGLDRSWIRAEGVTGVITDGDAPGLHAAWSLGVPTVAVGHGLIFAYCRLPPGLPWRGRAYEQLNAGSSAWLAQRRVGVHFLPIEPRDPRTLVARPDLDELDAHAAAAADGPQDGRVVAYFRDDNGGPVLEAAVAAGLRVRCFGGQSPLPRGVERHPLDRAAFLRALAQGPALIASAGSNALAEAVALGRPALAVHRPGDLEQEMNARLLQRAGLGMRLPLDRPAGPALTRFAHRLRRDQFARFDLRAAMPAVSQTVAGLVEVLERSHARPVRGLETG